MENSEALDGAGLIRDLTLTERPRQRLIDVGVDAMSSEELLAVVLRTGYKGKGAASVAKDILAINTLDEIFGMPVQRLSALRGMGISRAGVLLAAAELHKRTQKVSDVAMPVMRSMNDIVSQSIDLRAKKREHLVAFFLNARHQLLSKDVISIGTLTASLAHPREIFAPAIGKSAAGVILVHNHPSGDPAPSDEDNRLTKRIAQAGQIMGIELLDHLIIAEGGCYSFKTSGQL